MRRWHSRSTGRIRCTRYEICGGGGEKQALPLRKLRVRMTSFKVMKFFCHLAAVLLLSAAAGACAQISNPDDLVAPVPKNPAANHGRPTNLQDDLQWMWAFAQPGPNGRADDLRLDARFQLLLAR